jgi:hypothetical protein
MNIGPLWLFVESALELIIALISFSLEALLSLFFFFLLFLYFFFFLFFLFFFFFFFFFCYRRPGLVIRPFTRRPAAPPADLFDEHWAHLAVAVADIHSERASARGKELLYRSVEALAVHGHGARLYAALQGALRERVAAIARELAGPGTAPGTTPAASTAAEFLARADAAWAAHARHTQLIASVFIYLDRTYVVQTPGAVTIWDLGVALFRDLVASAPQVTAYTVPGFLELVALERAGEAVDRALLMSHTSMLSQTGLYHSVLERRVIEATGEHYTTQTQRLISAMEVPAYLALAAARLDSEAERCEAYLLPTTRRPLLATAERQLVAIHAESLITRGFEAMMTAAAASMAMSIGGGGAAASSSSSSMTTSSSSSSSSSSSAMAPGAAAGAAQPLATMFRLFYRVGELPRLRTALRAYVSRVGTEIVAGRGRDVVVTTPAASSAKQPPQSPAAAESASSSPSKSATSTTTTTAAPAPAPSSSSSSSSADSQMVGSLISFRRELDAICDACFPGDELSRQAVREAFEGFVNLNAARTAELIAKFVDARLRSGGRGATDDELERDLDEAMMLFRFVRGKDVFEAFYKKDLSKRLLLGKSASTDAEKTMISKLKQECGSAFTSKLEGMFRDIDVSRDFMREHAQTPAAVQDAEETGIDFAVHVLTMGFWPTHEPVEVQLPGPIVRLQRAFEKAYLAKQPNRRLTWWDAQGHCIVRAKFPAGAKELAVSAFQAAVLFLFNSSDDTPLAYPAIRAATGLEDTELKRTLQSLACAKVQVLRKEPRSREINDTDTFVFNEKFTSRLFRIKINTIQLKETPEENKSTTESVFQDRHYAIDAAVVRVMKTRKTLPHVQLIGQLIELLKFPTTAADLKARIESLIDREYLERDKGNPQVYNYLA